MEKHGNAGESFPTDTAGLPPARPTETTRLVDGGPFALRIAPVAKRLGETTVRMLAYNGSIPGPTMRIPQGSEVTVDVTNEAGLETTVHWHGLRLDNAFDGTHDTQAPIPVGGTFSYRVRCPDPGLYWYHPHVREDYGQEMGLYANILVDPADPEYWPPVHREVVLTLDDVLIEDGKIAKFSGDETNYAVMGRFGNVMLVNGETDLALSAQAGEVVRLYLTNTANARVFNVALPGARMKLVGGDSGRYEREEWVESIVLAPSERVVVDVRFERAGALALEHRTPKRTYVLAKIDVRPEPAPPLAQPFDVLRENAEWKEERARMAQSLAAPPDKTLAIVAEMDLGVPEGPVTYSCPMHLDVVREKPGRCPKCWMKLLATAAATTFVCPMHPDVVQDKAGRCPKCRMKLVPGTVVAGAKVPHGHDKPHDHEDAHSHDDANGGIEWEDDMVDVNRITTSKNTRWKFVDRDSGAVNHAIHWTFRVGDRVKIRVVNEMESDHPMHHPFHVHGAGRFLVLARGGVPEPNLVWKDTVLVRTGETVDLLLEVTNPGVWMAHCHIAEHHESGMMFSFEVLPA
jgi:FtsP/CotA-like multicopper oxidase with cupredoxin domain